MSAPTATDAIVDIVDHQACSHQRRSVSRIRLDENIYWGLICEYWALQTQGIGLEVEFYCLPSRFVRTASERMHV